MIKYGRTTSFHTYSAKTAAILQAIFLVSGFFRSGGRFGPVVWLFWLAISISILETAEEIILTVYLKEWTTNIKGLFWIVRREKMVS